MNKALGDRFTKLIVNRMCQITLTIFLRPHLQYQHILLNRRT